MEIISVTKIFLLVLGCIVIVVLLFPVLLVVLLIYERILIRKGILKKGMNLGKVFKGI